MVKLIKTGDRIEINELADIASIKTYVSQVEEITGDTTVLIHAPIFEGKTIRLPEGRTFSMTFFTSGGMYKYQARIEGSSKDRGFSFLNVTILDEGEKIQRREYFRFSCLVPLKFGLIDESMPEKKLERSSLRDGIVKDLSGGGLRFITNEEIEDNALIHCIMMLGDSHITVAMRVLNKQHFPKSNYKFQYRGNFVGSFKTASDLIIKFIFNEQRKQMTRERYSGGNPDA